MRMRGLKAGVVNDCDGTQLLQLMRMRGLKDQRSLSCNDFVCCNSCACVA